MKLSFRNILSIAILILFFLYERIYMANMLYERIDSSTLVATNVLLMLFGCLILYLIGRYNSWKEALHIRYTQFTIVLYLICCYHAQESGLTISYYIMLLYPLLFFLFAYQNCNDGTADLLRKGVLLIILGLFIEYITTYQDLVLAKGKDLEVTNSSYFLLYLLPFALICKDKKYRTIYTLLISFAVVISLKRGGVLALSLGLLVYYWFNLKKTGTSTSSILKYVLIIVILGIIALVIDHIMGGIISSRFQDISDSSRAELYPIVMSMIGNSSTSDLILGHGWNTVLRDNPMSFSAHNDILEMIYDIGIVGFVFYMLMIFGMFKTANKLVKNGSTLAPAAASFIAIFCVNSMVSHIILSLTYFSMVSLFWGFVHSQMKNESSI